MKIILRTFAVATLAVALSACALLGQWGIGQGAQDTGRGVLTAYELAQEGALIYGALPVCDPALPDVKICRNKDLWIKIKVAEDAATTAIIAAKPALRGDKLDAGEIAAAVTAIAAVKDLLTSAHKELGK